MNSPGSRSVIIGSFVAALAVGLIIALALRKRRPPLRTVGHVDLARFMGDWRVIGEIPYFAEKKCVDSIESYALEPDGTINNWFTARPGSFDEPRRQLANPSAYVVDPKTNAEWRIRFAGVIRVKYLIVDLDPDYRWTAVGHPSRNYGWIMAREKTLPEETYRAILGRLGRQGYDVARFRKVPQFPGQLREPNSAFP